MELYTLGFKKLLNFFGILQIYLKHYSERLQFCVLKISQTSFSVKILKTHVKITPL